MINIAENLSVMNDLRFARLVKACGLPKNDRAISRNDKEAIAYNHYFVGADSRLFAWKAGCDKADVATGIWPTDMYEVVRVSDIARVIAAEHRALAGAKAEALFKSLQNKYKGITH